MIGVFVPELEALLSESRSRPKLIEGLLARAACRPLAPSAPAAQVLSGQPLPAAAVSRLRDARDQAEGVIWMRADPVVLVPDLNAVWVRPAKGLGSDHPAVAELTELFAESGLAYLPGDVPGSEGRGYLRLPHLPDCQFSPPWTLPGRSLDHAQPEGPQAGLWKRLLNETQIILHQYREHSEVGGLWFWGAGALPPRASLKPPYSHLCASDPELLSLADWLGLSHEPLDAPARVADGSLVCWLADPGLDGQANLQALADWLKPLWRRLLGRRIAALELAGRGHAWRLGPAQAWQLWRRTAVLPA